MVKYSVAAVLACLYVLCASWVIRNEGMSYRQSLKRTRLTAQASSRPAPDMTEREERTAPLARASVAAKPRPAPSESQSRAADVVAEPRTSPEAKAAPAPPATALVTTKPVVPPPPRPAPSRRPAIANNPAVPAAAGHDAFWEAPALNKVRDLSKLKPEDEVLLGAELHDVIVRLNPPLENGPWLKRVSNAAERLLEARIRKDIEYTFTILDSDAVNAFSHPGGYIYICRGLFDLIGEDEEYALQFVIGHEIAHVDRRDSLTCAQDPGVTKLDMGTLRVFYALIIPWGYYPDDMDFKADQWSYEQMKRLGSTRHECLAFLRKLEGYAKIQKFENGRQPPKPGPESSLLDNHFRAHPAAWKRIEKLKKLP